MPDDPINNANENEAGAQADAAAGGVPNAQGAAAADAAAQAADANAQGAAGANAQGAAGANAQGAAGANAQGAAGANAAAADAAAVDPAAQAADANAQGAAGANAAPPGADPNAQGVAGANAAAPGAAPGADLNAQGAAGADAVTPGADANAQAPAGPGSSTGTPEAKGGQGSANADNRNGGNGSGGAHDAASRPCTEREKIFTWLTVGQYGVLALIGGIIVYYLFRSLFPDDTSIFLYSLSKPEVARGVITFLIAAGTVSLAVLLVMAAIMSSGSKDLDQRFGFGKEVLTLLIGILGTIVGFYYGSAKDNVTPLTLSPVAISSSTPAAGDKFTLDALITGGAPPYTYSIKFSSQDVFHDVIDQTSEGPVHHEFDIPATAKAEQITFTIEVKDARNQSITYNKDGKQNIKVQAGSGTASPTTPPGP